MKSYPLVFLAMVAANIATMFVAAAFIDPATRDDSSYLAAIIDKHERAAAQPSPRVLLFGGSNLAFGIDSMHLESVWNCPVVNMGLQGGFGLDFILGEAEYTVRRGDTIILVLEYGMLERNGRPKEPELIQRVNEIFPPSVRFANASRIDLFISLLNRSRRRLWQLGQESISGLILRDRVILETLPQAIYSRESFNAHGDIVAHLSLAPMGPPLPSPKHYELDSHAIVDRLERFVSAMTESGVTVIFAFPPLAWTWFETNEAEILEFYDELVGREQLQSIGHPSEVAFPNDSFFDSAYHLGADARHQRTIELGSQIALSGCELVNTSPTQ